MKLDWYYVYHIIMGSILSTSTFWKSALGSPCPEPRRADLTDSSHFYYCINLPFPYVDHVWISASCNYGLVFQPLLKMCVISQEMPCCNDKINTGNSGKGIFEGKNIETPNTAPAAAAVLTFLHNSANVYYQTLRTTTTSTNTDATLQPSIKSPYDHSTNNQIILPEVTAYQEVHKKPVTTITPLIRTSQKQHISTKESSSRSTNKFSTGLLQPQRSPGLNIPCTTGLRLPNLTDCTRYYTCNSTSGTLLSYSCPSQMAFNADKHVCEVTVYKGCKEQMISNSYLITQPPEFITPVTTPNPTLCFQPGKIPDPESSHHYFICNHHSDTLVQYRMTCPNTLHFCARENACKKQNDCSY